MLLAALAALLPVNAGYAASPSPAQVSNSRIHSVHASKNSSMVALTISSSTVCTVDANSGAVERRIELDGSRYHGDPILAPDGRTLAIKVYGEVPTPLLDRYRRPQTWSIFETSGDAPARVCTPVTQAFQDDPPLTFAPDSKQALLVLDAGHVAVIDVPSGRTTALLVDPDGQELICACWWGKSRILAAGSKGVVRLWDASQGDLLATPMSTGFRTGRLAVSPDGERVIATGTAHATPVGQMWRLPDFARISDFRAVGIMLDLGGDFFDVVDWSPCSDLVVLTTCTWRTVECRSRDGVLVWSHDYNGGNPSRMRARFDLTGSMLSFVSNMGGSGVYDAWTQAPRNPANFPPSEWIEVEWTGDGRSVVLRNRDAKRVSILDSATLDVRFELRFSPTGDLVVERPK